MSTKFTDDTTVPGTRIDEALGDALRTPRQIRQAGRRYLDTLTATAAAFRQSHHERNFKARKARKLAKVTDARA